MQKERDEPFSISELSTTEYEFEDTKYLKISFNDSENARIILDYEDSKNLKEYLDQNPFEFKVKNKTVDVKFTNFVKENSHTYQVDIETSDMVVVELPTLYYKSYKISLKTETGTKELKPVHGEDGLIEVNVSESGTLVVEFEGNYIKAANIVSICGVVCGVALVVSLFIFEKRAKASKKNIKNYKNKLKK